MTNNQKKTPTADIIREYQQLTDYLSSIDPTCSADEVNRASMRQSELEEQYDFS